MKKFFLTAALAIAVASPALAGSKQSLRSNAAADAAYASADVPYADAAYAYTPLDSATVIAEGKVLGRDPDIFIRQSLQREGDPADLAGN